MADKLPKVRIVLGSPEQPVRFSYANVFAPRENLNGDLEYSVSILIPKDHDQTLKVFQDGYQQALAKGKAELWGGTIPKFKYQVLKDGDEEYPDKPEYAGMFFINAKSDPKHAPEILDERKYRITDEEEFDSGDYGQVSIELVPYDNQKAKVKGIKPALGNIRKLAKGDRFGGSGRSAASDFGEPEEDGMD